MTIFFRKRLLGAIGPSAVIQVSRLIGALLAEIVYRAYLVYKVPGRFDQPKREKVFGATNVSLWELDERFGNVQPPGRVIEQVAVADGHVSLCERSSAINEFGNICPGCRKLGYRLAQDRALTGFLLNPLRAIERNS